MDSCTKIRLCSFPYIFHFWCYIDSEKLKSIRNIPNKCLFIIQSKSKIIGKKQFNILKSLSKKLTIIAQEDHIINIPSIVSYSTRMLQWMIKWVEIKVSKYLTCQVPDWKSSSRRNSKKRFIFWEEIPIFLFSLDTTISRRIILDDLLAQWDYKINIITLICPL